MKLEKITIKCKTGTVELPLWKECEECLGIGHISVDSPNLSIIQNNPLSECCEKIAIAEGWINNFVTEALAKIKEGDKK